jgi:hypothetical protein
MITEVMVHVERYRIPCMCFLSVLPSLLRPVAVPVLVYFEYHLHLSHVNSIFSSSVTEMPFLSSTLITRSCHLRPRTDLFSCIHYSLLSPLHISFLVILLLILFLILSLTLILILVFTPSLYSPSLPPSFRTSHLHSFTIFTLPPALLHSFTNFTFPSSLFH